MLLCRTGHCAAKQISTTGCLYFALFTLPLGIFIMQNLRGPCQPHKAIMCCPAFARSCEMTKEAPQPPKGEQKLNYLFPTLGSSQVATIKRPPADINTQSC